MTHIERFNAILDYKKPDKLPLFIPTMACSVASEILGYPAITGGESIHYKEQKARFEGECAFREFEDCYYHDTFKLAKALNVDIVRDTWRKSRTPVEMPDEYTMKFNDGGPISIAKYFPKTESYGYIRDDASPDDPNVFIKLIERELETMTSREELEQWENSPQFEDDMLSQNRGVLKITELANDEYPVIAGGAGFGFLPDNVGWLQATVMYPEILEPYFIRKAEASLPRIRWMAKRGYRLLTGGLDLAGNTDVVFSPKTFERLLAPAYKIVSDECKRLGVTYTFGSDGNYMKIADIIFKDIGINACVETEQAAGMEVGVLRKKYPDLIVVGAINSGTLHRGTTDDVRKEVRQSLEESEGVQYIPGPSNAVMPGTPVENIYAMIEEIDDFR